MAKIKVDSLTKIFGRNVKTALEKMKSGESKDKIFKETGSTVGVNQATFEVSEGETFVIMGLSGSGKSTLIRCLNLLNEPTEGAVIIEGDNILEYDKNKLKELRQNRMSMVFQHFGLFTHRSVIANVEYGLEVRQVPKKERQEIATRTLASVGLEGWENKMPDELSGGMKQRVGLARALANDPDILLMDEPFSALDPLIKREMQTELLELQSRLKKTIVFITHDINEAFRIGDRVAIMKDGIIEQIDTPENILSEPANEYIENFIKDIDRTKILQAQHIMFKPTALISLKDGPKIAARNMNIYGISSIFVVDNERRLQGIVTIDDTIEAIKEGKTLNEVLKKDYYTAHPEESMQELFPKASDTKYPIAVIDEDNKLQGIIVRVAVLSSLAAN